MSRLLIVPLVFLLTLPPVGVPAQVVQEAHVQLTPRDSLRNLSQAHDAQFRFESLRRMNLPRLQPSAPQACDATVGRMCYWDEDSDATEHDSSTIAEGAPILRARRRLVAVLDRLSAIAPGDVWIAGQRVRYLVESGTDSTAIEAAHQCRAAAWWCELLNGYALHSAGDYAASEAVFDSALTAMPHDARCKWSDISLLLEDRERDNYQRLPCDSRHELEQRFWKLAQPSYAVHGNDRRTEHFSRVLLAELLSSSANAYGMSWGDDMREILIRYGPPMWYASNWPTALGSVSSITGHDRNHSYHFAAAGDGEKTRWDIRSKNARERYAPPYMDSLTDLSAQFAMLKRGDSAVVIAIYADAVKSDSAVLGLAGDSGTIVVMHDSVHAHVRRARTAWKEIVAGIENYDPVRRIDARARTFIEPPRAAPGAPELSTLLLFSGDTTAGTGSPDGSPGFSQDGSINRPLEDALAHALTTDELGGARKLGLYWEMYGANAADTAQENVSISVTRTDGGVLKWLAQALRVTPRDSPLAMQWHEAQLGSGATARSVILDLAQLPAGTYHIAVGVGPGTGTQTITSRDVRLR